VPISGKPEIGVLARARALVDRLWPSVDPADVARLAAQARLIAAYEESRWPRRPPRTADLIRHLMDQHGLARAELVPLLGTPSRVSEVLAGKKELSMAMVQRLRARFRVPADVLLPLPRKPRRDSWRLGVMSAGRVRGISAFTRVFRRTMPRPYDRR